MLGDSATNPAEMRAFQERFHLDSLGEASFTASLKTCIGMWVDRIEVMMAPGCGSPQKCLTNKVSTCGSRWKLGNDPGLGTVVRSRLPLHWREV